MIVGLDARPALFGRTGFGRVVRETVGALGRHAPQVDLRLFGAAWRRARPDASLDGVRAPRLPARVQSLLAPFGFGVETILGPLDVYHHTDLVFAPVARTPQVLTIYDLVFLQDASWHTPGFAARVLPRLARVARAARRVVVPCPMVADDVVRHGLCASDRLHVVPLGADHLSDTPLPDDEARVLRLLDRVGLPTDASGPLVLLPGTREPRKNQLALLEAFLDVAPGTGARLLLVGPRGWGCEGLERLLREVTGGPLVGVAGEVPEADLAALMRRADIVAYPSLAEGFGLPVAEAMRCGRAVLTSRGTPMEDFGGEAVVAVDPRDPAALRSGLTQLLEDADLRAGLGAAAREAIAGYSWKAHSDALVHVYEGAVS